MTLNAKELNQMASESDGTDKKQGTYHPGKAKTRIKPLTQEQKGVIWGTLPPEETARINEEDRIIRKKAGLPKRSTKAQLVKDAKRVKKMRGNDLL